LVALENKLQLAKQTQLKQLLFNKKIKKIKELKEMGLANGPSYEP